MRQQLTADEARQHPDRLGDDTWVHLPHMLKVADVERELADDGRVVVHCWDLDDRGHWRGGPHLKVRVPRETMITVAR